MTDPGSLVMEAAARAGVPCWRNAWQGTEGSHPPEVYGVFNVHAAPGYSAEDVVQAQRYWVYLSIYGTGDVWAAGSRLEEEMTGWLCTDRRDVYDQQAGRDMHAMSFYMEVEG